MEEKKNNAVIKSIEIKNLFGYFNYNIKYPFEENVLILTGPNGFGKTQLLNIVHYLFNRKFAQLQNIVFESIIIELSSNVKIRIINHDNKSLDFFIIYDNGNEDEYFTYNNKTTEYVLRQISENFNIVRVNDDQWYERETGKELTTDELIDEYLYKLPDNFIKKSYFRIDNLRASEILDSIDVHFIREQRLFERIVKTDSNYRNSRKQTLIKASVDTCSNELKQSIAELFQHSFIIAQSIDSTYLNRLISEKNIVTEEEYNSRLNNIIQKQEKLKKYGLYVSENEVLNYSKEDAKALLLYLNDLEQKLSVYDKLILKLELFTSIINERRFTFKTIGVDRIKGIYVRTNNGKELNLSQLSSGEQHEVVLLYELIFKTKRSMIVLIDEPELSLHVTWQKGFVEDLLKIIHIQKFQVIIATHSPSIINDRWDLVYNLEI